MPLVDLSGAIDLHIHSNPSLFTRVGSDLDIARHAADNNLTAILRVFTQCLMEKGVTQEQIDIMTKRNPARLLGL